MLNRLSKQERILIISLLTIVIWAAGIMLVIKPNIEKNSEVKERLKTAEQQKQDLELKLASEDELKANIVKTKGEVYETLKNFFPATPNYDADQYIAKLWQGNGLTIQNVAITDPTATTLDYYSYLKQDISYPLGDYAKSQRSGSPVGALATSDEVETETKTAESCEIASVSVTVQGSQEQIRNFVNAINNDEKTLLVKTVSAAEASGTWNATIGIDFIAVDKYE